LAHLQNYRIIILDSSHLVMYNFGSGLLAIEGRIGRTEEEKLQKGETSRNRQKLIFNLDPACADACARSCEYEPDPQGRGKLRSDDDDFFVQSTSEAVTRLEKQGNLPSDAYTAMTLEEQTGVPMLTWLAVRKSGKP